MAEWVFITANLAIMVTMGIEATRTTMEAIPDTTDTTPTATITPEPITAIPTLIMGIRKVE